MPKYIVNTPTFNPIDFEQRIKPMEAYVNTYNKQQDALDEAGILGDTIGSLLDPERDKDLYTSYTNYSNLLNNTVDEMIRTGDISTSRNNLRALRRQYANELVPIKQGYDTWQKAIESYDKAREKDPTFIGTDPRGYSISNYMKGASPSDHYVSGNALYAMGQADSKVASARRKLFDDWKLNPQLGGQYFSRAVIEGWSQDELSNALAAGIVQSGGKLPDKAELDSATRYLYDAYNRIADNFKIDRFRNSDGSLTENYTQAGDFILNGLLSGIGYDYTEEMKGNEAYLNPLQQAQLNNLNREAAAAENADLGGASMPYVNIPFVDASGAIDTSKYQEDMEFLAKMLDNPALLNEEREEPPITVVTPQNEFHPVIDEGRKVKYNVDRLQSISRKYGLSFTLDEKDGVYNLEGAEAAISKLANDVAKNAKLYQATQYRTTDDSNVVDVVNNASKVAGGIVDASGRKSKEVSSIPKGGTFILNPTLTGNQNYIEYKVEDKDGNVKTYKVSPENFSNRMRGYIETYKQAVAAGDIQNVAAWRHQIMTEIYTTANGRAKTQTDTDSKLGAEE